VEEVMLSDIQLPEEYARGPEGLLLKEQEDDQLGVVTDIQEKPVRMAELQAESESGNRRWQFRLRPGVHFHNGSPLTTGSVVASLAASCTANCPWNAVHAVGSSIVITAIRQCQTCLRCWPAASFSSLSSSRQTVK
jgi:hypothetical protein